MASARNRKALVSGLITLIISASALADVISVTTDMLQITVNGNEAALLEKDLLDAGVVANSYGEIETKGILIEMTTHRSCISAEVIITKIDGKIIDLNKSQVCSGKEVDKAKQFLAFAEALDLQANMAGILRITIAAPSCTPKTWGEPSDQCTISVYKTMDITSPFNSEKDPKGLSSIIDLMAQGRQQSSIGG